jgi:hypothetical protein
MSTTPFIAGRGSWYRPGIPRPGTPPVPRIVERLRRMLVWDELRRTRQGAWPPAITLPQLHALAEPGKES